MRPTRLLGEEGPLGIRCSEGGKACELGRLLFCRSGEPGRPAGGCGGENIQGCEGDTFCIDVRSMRLADKLWRTVGRTWGSSRPFALVDKPDVGPDV